MLTRLKTLSAAMREHDRHLAECECSTRCADCAETSLGEAIALGLLMAVLLALGIGVLLVRYGEQIGAVFWPLLRG